MSPPVRWRVLAVALAVVTVVTVVGASQGAPVQAAKQPALSGWLSFGNNAERVGAATQALDPATLRPAWYRETQGIVTTQPLVVQNVPAKGQTTIFTANNFGQLVAYAPNGYVRWQRNLGAAPNSCIQLSSYGITGTPVVDAATRSIFLVDAFGLLHSIDLVTGRDRPGWPVELYNDPDHELDWGALADVGGSIYVGTAAYCDEPMVGKLFRVQIATRAVSSLVLVPQSLGGGGGVWGWGGVAYSAERKALYVVTANAFQVDQAAGYGEQLVELTPDLKVVASFHPPDVKGTDVDFVGSPIVFTPHGCPELVGALNKVGRLYVWNDSTVAAGPYADVVVQPASVDQPLLSQPAYDAATDSVYVVASDAVVRVQLDGCTGAHVVWRQTLPFVTLHGSPTIAGPIVWFAVGGSPAQLRGYNAVTGRLVYEHELGVLSFDPPTIVGGRLYEGGRHAFADASAAPSRPSAAATLARGHTSWSDKRHGWQAREGGVYATDDGGHIWRRISKLVAQRVLRVSATRGVISVSTSPTSCNCAQRNLWTSNGGKTWHTTIALDPDFTSSGGIVYTWNTNTMRQAAWPPVRSTPLTTFPEEVADAAGVPGGVLALLTDEGKSYDDAVRLALVRGSSTTTFTLPAESGRVLAHGLKVDWPTVVVRTYVYTDSGRRTVLFQSTNGGQSWQAN